MSPLVFLWKDSLHVDTEGYLLGVGSGALASSLFYVLWYTVLPKLPATLAATVQLTVPVIAALMGALFLGEALSLRFGLSALCILGGVALVIIAKAKKS